MIAVTTHQNADFDALASMVAATKLYPQSQPVFPGGLNQNVHEFVTLYRDVLNIKYQKEIDFSAVELLVVTDTKQKNRIGLFVKHLANIPEIHIYDHHPDTDNDITAHQLVYEEIGATTTLILERIFAKNIPLSPFEATLFALGIYEDTGCLTFDSTTMRDVAALHRLWEIGVNLRVVNEFLNRPLSEEQRSILDHMLTATEYHELRGVRVAVTTADSANYVNGLALLTHKLIEIEDVDVVFSVVSMEDRIYVVGRSRMEHFDLGRVLAVFGGKGHPRAASATVKGSSLAEVREKLVGTLYREILPVTTAKEMMSTPVRTIAADTTVDKARELMMRYGHSGFPVTENEKLVGIISRRDLEKAGHHGLGHAPVKGYMNKKPLTVPHDVSVKKVQQMMIENNVGRLPVMEDGSIVGIVTRTDVLRNLEGGAKVTCNGESSIPADGDDITPLINERLPKESQSLLLLIGQKADMENVSVYAVGGFIRDLLLNIPNQDLDLVVEPEAIPFAQTLNDLLGGQLKTHEQFGTAQINLPDGRQIDLVTSRQEFYARPAALPEVEQSSLKNDLFRRDFTINTLACSLNSPRFGRLYDFFHGISDLEKGLIRTLYNLSFVEDPLRLLRAIRFEQRFSFTIEETTFSLVENAVQTRTLEKVSKERIYEELKLALLEEKAPEILVRYFELGLDALIFPGVRFENKLSRRLFAVREMLSWVKRRWADAAPLTEAVYLSAVLLEAPFQEARHLCRRLRLHKDERERIMAVVEAVPRLKTLFLAEKSLTPSEIFYALDGQPVETLLMLQAECEESRIWEYTSLYWEKLRHLQGHVSGRDLLELGYSPGPRFQQILRSVHEERLNGRIQGKEEELAYIKEMLASSTGEES
ncbi:MAG: CBS domain-containing protein [Clostridiales bacterium]|jgi:tRNA nucleotidyltransferase (CCA-adding enzyme)|nr:CBS domain-containing protein [Clostridiales bacterium]